MQVGVKPDNEGEKEVAGWDGLGRGTGIIKFGSRELAHFYVRRDP